MGLGMTEPRGNELFPAPEPVDPDRQRDATTGLLPSQLLREAVAQGREILSPQPIDDDQIQPASIDLRLGEVAHRVRASFLPGPKASVRDKLDLLSMHRRIDLTGGAGPCGEEHRRTCTSQLTHHLRDGCRQAAWNDKWQTLIS